MTDPYLFDRGIGQQMGDLCRLAVGDAKATQTGNIVTLEDMLGRGTMGVSVEVPYTSGGVQSVSVTRCGKNLYNIFSDKRAAANLYAANPRNTGKLLDNIYYFGGMYGDSDGANIPIYLPVGTSFTVSINNVVGADLYGGIFTCWAGKNLNAQNVATRVGVMFVTQYDPIPSRMASSGTVPSDAQFIVPLSVAHHSSGIYRIGSSSIQVELGSTATAYEPYNGETHTISLPADVYGGTVNLEAGTVTSRYAADGTELAEPVVTEIDPISIPILAGVNNVWADVGTVTVSYYAADAQEFRPALWYPTIYRGLTSARYLIKRASGAIASFSDGIAAPLVGLRVALPYDAEGYQSVSVTVNGTLTTITLPANFYGGYLDVVTGQLVATHDENGNLLTNQKLYFLPPTNINALAGVNNVRSDAGDVAVSYRIDNG